MYKLIPVRYFSYRLDYKSIFGVKAKSTKSSYQRFFSQEMVITLSKSMRLVS